MTDMTRKTFERRFFEIGQWVKIACTPVNGSYIPRGEDKAVTGESNDAAMEIKQSVSIDADATASKSESASENKSKNEECISAADDIYPSIIEYVNIMEDKRNRHIILDRLGGNTLQVIGDRYDITRERVRQICKKVLRAAHKRGRCFREDKYLRFFSKYLISRDDFTFAFDEPLSTYEYLNIMCSAKSQEKKSLEYVLKDEDIPVLIRMKAERAIYRFFVTVNGQQIHKDKQSLINFYLKTYCRDLTHIEAFESGYQNFLDELGLSCDENLMLKRDIHAIEAYLNRQPCILWNQGRRFRYYDIQLRDYGRLLEAVNLKQYDGMEISTLKLLRENTALMNEYDIRDEYELHNLLKRIWKETDYSVEFKKMPTIEIGSVSRDNQVLSLLSQCSPVSKQHFAVLYEEAYGIKSSTVLANYLNNADKNCFE